MASAATGNVAEVLAAYEPKEATFQKPSGRGELGRHGSGPRIRPDADLNIPGVTKTGPSKIIHKELWDSGVIGMVDRVSWGRYCGGDACLITFSFAIKSGDSALRFRKANVKVTFEKHTASMPQQANPSVLIFAPRKISGTPTTEHKSLEFHADVEAKAGIGPVDAGPTIGFRKTSSFKREHWYKLTGNHFATKHGTGLDIVYWDAKENPKTKDGIPDQLNMGVIVSAEGPFQAVVEVTVDTPLKSGLFGFPWSKDNPVPFFPGVEKGLLPVAIDFETFTEADWKTMIPHEEGWQNIFVSERLTRQDKTSPADESKS